MAPHPLGDPIGHLGDRARDLVYTGVGLGVLGVQRVQVQRRSLERALGIGLPPTSDDLGRLFGRLTGQH